MTTPEPQPFRYVDEDEFCLSARLLPDFDTGGVTDTLSITIEGDGEPQSAHVPVADMPQVLAGLAAASGVQPDTRPAIPSHVWQVWCEDGPVHGFYATEDDAKQGSIDCWQETEPSCPDYSWAKDGPRLELLVGGVRGGICISRQPVYGRHLTAAANGGQAEDGAQPETGRGFLYPDRCLSVYWIFRCEKPVGHDGGHRLGKTTWGRIPQTGPTTGDGAQQK